MDVRCPTCGEPWEFDSIHEEAQDRYGIPYYEEPDAQGYYYGQPYFTKVKNDEYNEDDYQKIFKEVTHEFQSIGCKALKSFTDGDYCVPNKHSATDKTFGLTAAEASSALYDILGDDLDGAAAMLEDLGF